MERLRTELRGELESLLKEKFPDAQVLLEPIRPATKLSGIVVWNGFAKLDSFDRQSLLWRTIRARFDRDDQIMISGLIALTPAEYAAHREPQIA